MIIVKYATLWSILHSYKLILNKQIPAYLDSHFMALLLGFHSQPLMLVQGWCNSCSSNNRAFSCDVMLSSNMAGFYSNGNQYSFMQASVIVHNGFSMNFSIRGSSAWWLRARAWLPWISRSVCTIQLAMLEDSMTSVKTRYCSGMISLLTKRLSEGFHWVSGSG